MSDPVGLLVVCMRPDQLHSEPVTGSVPVSCAICGCTVLVSPASTLLLVTGARAVCLECAELVRPGVARD